MDDNGLAAGRHVHLLGRGDVQVPQVSLEVCIGGLQVKQGLLGWRWVTAATEDAIVAATAVANASDLINMMRTCATDSSNASGSAPLSLAIFFLAVNIVLLGGVFRSPADGRA